MKPRSVFGTLATAALSTALFLASPDQRCSAETQSAVDQGAVDQGAENPIAGTESSEPRTAEEWIAKIESAPPSELSYLAGKLIALGPSALEATRRAQQEAKDPKLLSVFKKASVWIVAREVAPVLRAGVATDLTFDGQYAELSKIDDEVHKALLALIDDSATDFPIRVAACHALADVGSRAILERIRDLHYDVLLPYDLREQLGILMAIFGDTHVVEREIRDGVRLSRRSFPDMREDLSFNVRVNAHIQLANLYYRIRDYKKAVDYYEEIIELYTTHINLTSQFKQYADSRRQQLILHYYNAACSNALFGNLKRSKEYLKNAVQGEPSHYDNMEKDGDLAKLRADPSYGEFRKELGELFEDEDL